MPRPLAFAIPVAIFASLTAAACALHVDPTITADPPRDAQGSGGGGGSGGSDAGPAIEPRIAVLADITTANTSAALQSALAGGCPAGYFLANVNDAWQTWTGSAYKFVMVLQCTTAAGAYHAGATAADVHVVEIDGQSTVAGMTALMGTACPAPAGYVYRWGHLVNDYNSSAKKNRFACGFDNGPL